MTVNSASFFKLAFENVTLLSNSYQTVLQTLLINLKTLGTIKTSGFNSNKMFFDINIWIL